jgi:hypothetical protein
MREQRVGFVVHPCKLAVGDGKVGEEGECGGLERGGLWLACLGMGVGGIVEGGDGWEGRVWVWAWAGSAEFLRS